MSCSITRPTTTMEDAISTIAAMRHQEMTGYRTNDYLNHRSFTLDVDADCRRKMAAWSYQVVDFCKFSRESVEIAMSYLDRYLLTTSGIRALQDRSVFQLAAMTSLYTAVKIHEPEAMDPNLVSSLSRGTYSPDDVEEMERILLQAIQWRMNPPTSLSFVRQFLNLIPNEAMDEQMKETIYEVTKFQTELAVSEYEFITVQASVTAYCSFMNALESLDTVDPKVLQYITAIVQQSIGITNTEHVIDVQSYLYQAIVRNETPATTTKPVPQQKVQRTLSPRSVMQPC